ncbi:MAG TPA: EamA family transporter, partial [Oceanicaulis sp.]|nr:EamA family transporter [Oceanicaulis sp.]
VQPIVAAAAGWLLFDEALSAIQLLGAAIILAGLYLAQRTAPRPAASVPPAPE